MLMYFVMMALGHAVSSSQSQPAITLTSSPSDSLKDLVMQGLSRSGASGRIAPFKIAGDGKTVGCQESGFGDDDLGFSGLCEAIDGGNIQNFEPMIGKSLKDVSEGVVAFYIETLPEIGSGNVTIAPGSAHLVLGGAEFSVLPSGKTINCKPLNLASIPMKRDLCGSGLLSDPVVAKMGAAKTVRVRIVADLWVK